jgi:hypothetical protein
MYILVQERDEVQSSEDINQTIQIPQQSIHNFGDVGNDDGSEDDLCFDECMA